MVQKPDPRLTPARGDVAAAALKGKVEAGRFVEPRPMTVAAAVAPLKGAAEPYGPLDSSLLFGQHFDVYDTRDGWSWGQAVSDGYVGYVPEATLADGALPSNHVVAMPMTHLYAEPSIKTEPVGMLFMNSAVQVEAEDGVFVRLPGGLYAHRSHVSDESAVDFVAIARMFLHAPYLWGGNSVQGIDCSGLVQAALMRAGRDCPRDSDMQEAMPGVAVDPDGPLQKGDLVFWKGHVGIMVTGAKLLHATEYTLRVIEEPFKAARKRIAAAGLEVTSVKRLG